MTTFVLVHGAWLGGWCWRRVARGLRSAGHEVLTPTLTGTGERAHLAAKEMGLHTHVLDLAASLWCEGVEDAVVVGHSYAGAVVTDLSGRCPPGRIRHLVYLDAFAPRPGQSVLDTMPAERARGMVTLAEEHGEGWLVPPRTAAQLQTEWLVTDPADLAWIVPRIRSFPLRCFSEALVEPAGSAVTPPRTFVSCTEGASVPTFATSAERARSEGWGYTELRSAHLPMVTTPDALTSLLVELAG